MSSRKMSLRMDQEVREAFALFDRDGDGKITRQEVTRLIQALEGDPECTHVQCLLRAAETNPIDLVEFMSLWKEFKAGVASSANNGSNVNNGDSGDEAETEEDVRSAFRTYDIDGDGYITKEEMIQVITRMGSVSNKEEEATKCIKEMDLDGDGRVSFAEFMLKWRVT